MESNQSPDDVRDLLGALHADRVCLADRLAAPSWFYPVFAAVTALHIGTPVLPDSNVGAAFAALPVAAAATLALLYPRISGVRPAAVRMVGWGVLIGLLVSVLGLLSVSYGVVASLSAWWVLLPQAVCFVVVLFGGRLFDGVYRTHLHAGGIRQLTGRRSRSN
ncbi:MULTISPECIES: hypothetical protein [unclassified Rhodococcus (in: high G+C Gram-positive bacteria)]|uniref:hypothetical protein n=1 Tax=unclassified Rhodococcus (in: high G+C Gram-positive bacteria) TaxID=192944 RepID=UPI0007BBA9E3|nr:MULTISPECIES: hypothetical protein [unclassified Rhodococcus (in: high G+C Gram-positive bacteria)]KZF09233.1 hypothetical protein A2J02_19130 [Rhodococcus sp. EPR-147]KZF10285.1 hypothetical protein A2J04_20770 [Rhodococcus sp. EPR-279]